MKEDDGNMVLGKPKLVSEMNVYEKLMHCRIELKNMKIKKTGKNNYSNYEYYELSDFIAPILDLCLSYKLFTQVSYQADAATLTVVNIDNPTEQIVFSSPMSTADLKGCHAVQNLGATETYERRYLYITAFEIVEPDVLDETMNKYYKNNHESKEERKLSYAQVKRLYAIANKKGFDTEKVKRQVQKCFGLDDIASMTKQQYDDICNKYETLT